jgi:hypothetical protein
MQLETVVVYAKLFCVFAGTSLLTLQTGLGQWSNVETNPSVVQWVMILGGSLGTGLTATGAFLSNAFGNYMGSRNGNGNGNGHSVPTPPVIVPPSTIVGNRVLTEAKKPDTVVS